MRYAILLAGGSGTRLWPLSRKSRPKQFLPLLTDLHGQPQSLLQHADERISKIISLQHRYVCTSQQLYDAVCLALPHYREEQIICEAMGQNTAHAIGLAATLLQRKDSNALLFISPSDHWIYPLERFSHYIDLGFRMIEAEPHRLLTFSIKPDHPATGYGYIKLGQALPSLVKHHSDVGQVFAVSEFTEKPDAQTAGQYFQSGMYRWNSGIFIFYASTYLLYMQRYLPKSYEALQRIVDAWNQPDHNSVFASEYTQLNAISIDSAIFEPASRSQEQPVCTMPMDVKWHDIGNWTSYGKLLQKDDAGNAVGGSIQSIMLASTNNLVFGESPEHTVALLGCKNLVVIHTKDATLVVPSEWGEKIKELYPLLNEKLR